MASDWTGVISNVARGADNTPTIMAVLTANANSDICLRELLVHTADAATQAVTIRIYRASGTASGGSTVTCNNLSSGSSETQRFVLRAATSAISGMTLVGEVRRITPASNFSTDSLSCGFGLNDPGVKLRGGESLVLEMTVGTSSSLQVPVFNFGITQ